MRAHHFLWKEELKVLRSDAQSSAFLSLLRCYGGQCHFLVLMTRLGKKSAAGTIWCLNVLSVTMKQFSFYFFFCGRVVCMSWATITSGTQGIGNYYVGNWDNPKNYKGPAPIPLQILSEKSKGGETARQHIALQPPSCHRWHNACVHMA